MNEAVSLSQSFSTAIRPTTIIESERLSERLNVRVLLASETFQHTGSFKFRGAYYLTSHVPQKHIIAASSGNFGQALARACSLLGKSCLVVMPSDSSEVKIAAVRSYGARVELIDTRVQIRAERVAELQHEFPESLVASAYDEPLVIAGNASLGEELAKLDENIDCIVVPIGGGGLSAGLLTGLRRLSKQTPVIGAEPLVANRMSRSLKERRIVALETEPATIADGARVLSIGRHNWELLRQGLAGVIEVPEENIKQAVRLLHDLANLKSEPTGALAVGALLTQPDTFYGRRVCCVITGGNVDGSLYRRIIGGE